MIAVELVASKRVRTQVVLQYLYDILVTESQIQLTVHCQAMYGQSYQSDCLTLITESHFEDLQTIACRSSLASYHLSSAPSVTS